jgi:serine/threonine protein kinase
VVKVFWISDLAVRDSARNEPSILKNLSHPLIVKFLDYFEDAQAKKAYLIMEKTGEMTLEELVKKKVLNEMEARSVLRQLLEAVKFSNS